MKTKKTLSIILVFSLMLSTIAVFSSTSATAASVFGMNLKNESNGMKVIFNKMPGTTKYRIYFGDGTPGKTNWWFYRDVYLGQDKIYDYSSASYYYPIYYTTLSQTNYWIRDYRCNIGSIPNNLSSGKTYLFQVQAMNGSSAGRWSYVRSMTYLSRPVITTKRNSLDKGGNAYVSWNPVPGANFYEAVRRYKGGNWLTVYSGSSTSFSDCKPGLGAGMGEWEYEVRAQYVTRNNGTANSFWSSSSFQLHYPLISVSSVTKEKDGDRYYYSVLLNPGNYMVYGNIQFEIDFYSYPSTKPCKVIHTQNYDWGGYIDKNCQSYTINYYVNGKVITPTTYVYDSPKTLTLFGYIQS